MVRRQYVYLRDCVQTGAVRRRFGGRLYEGMIPQCAIERQLRNEGLCIVNRTFSVVKQVAPNCVEDSRTYTAENGRQRIRYVTRMPVGEITHVVESAGFTSWTVERQFKSRDDYKALLFMAKDAQFFPDYEAYASAEKWMGEDVILRANVPAQGLHRVGRWPPAGHVLEPEPKRGQRLSQRLCTVR
jgi:hypothetical protein